MKNRGRCLVQENGSVIVGVATGMAGSDEPGRCASARSAIGSVLDHAVNVRINVTGDPYAGLIVEGAGGRVDHCQECSRARMEAARSPSCRSLIASAP